MFENRLTMGVAHVGGLELDHPGLRFGPAVRVQSSGSTAELVTAYQFPENAFVSNMYLRVLSVSATSASINVGLASASSSSLYNGFISAMPVGSTAFPMLSPCPGSTTYCGVLLASTGSQKRVVFAIGSCSTGGGAAGTATMRNLSVTVATTEAIDVQLLPVYVEIGD
jgi:hypothetical protein